jgi:leucyl aminopeptidase
MEYHIKNTPVEKQRAACIVVGVYESRQLSASAQHLDSISGGYLNKILATGDLEGKAGNTLMLHNVPNILGERVLLVGFGKSDELNAKAYQDILSGVLSTLYASATASAALYLFDEIVSDCDINWKIEQAVRTAHAQRYLAGKLKSKQEPVNGLKNLI